MALAAHRKAPMTTPRRRRTSTGGPVSFRPRSAHDRASKKRSAQNLEVAGVREGEVLAGKYRVGRVLGAGAMGVVVAAYHLQLDTTVAIKLLWPSLSRDREVLRRFSREARAVARIKSEHVPRVLDVGTLQNESPYMVMDFLDGADLARWMDTRGAPPIEQAVDFVLQACNAVAEAHSLGIVHRDLKPSNLFCIPRADGRHMIKVLDFGISKLASAGASLSDNLQTTQSNAAMGSPLYMSPEQIRSSRDVDARTDIWALGIILFELLALEAPFQGPALPDLCNQIAREAPLPLRSFRPDVPPGLEAVIHKCLEKAPENRFQSVVELADALLEFGPENARTLVGSVSWEGRRRALWQTRFDRRVGMIAAAVRLRSWLSRASIPAFVFVAVLSLAWIGTYLSRRSQPVVAPLGPVQLESHRATDTLPASPEAVGLASDPSVSVSSPILSSEPHAAKRPPAWSTPPKEGSTAQQRPSCDPPYFFDARGNRVFKVSCL
jgi:serine/threonine-protein kinase